MPPKGTHKVPCPKCNGRGTVAVGDVDVECDNCEGAGEVFESEDG